MAQTTQLGHADIMFVAGETESVYQHVAGLILLDVSDKPDFDFEHFRKHCIERVSLIPHFRWKLHSVPMGLDRPYWVEDEHFGVSLNDVVLAVVSSEKMYPMSILSAGIGINFTCISYTDFMDFGIMVDPGLVPGYETIPEKLQRALDVYVDLCSPEPSKSEKKPGKRMASQRRPGPEREQKLQGLLKPECRPLDCGKS